MRDHLDKKNYQLQTKDKEIGNLQIVKKDFQMQIKNQIHQIQFHEEHKSKALNALNAMRQLQRKSLSLEVSEVHLTF